MKKNVTLLLTLFMSAMGLWAQDGARIFVVNSLGENLSVVNLIDNTVQPNALSLGLFTNQIQRNGDFLYVVNSGVNSLQVIDKATVTTTNTIDVGSGTNPWHVNFIDENLALVSLLFTNEVVVVDLNNGQITQRIPTGTGPQPILVHNGFAYVGNSGFNGSGYDPGSITKINLNDYSTSTIAVGINPQAIVLDGNQMLVACTGNYADVGGRLDRVDLGSEMVVDSIEAGTAITNVVAQNGRAYLSTFGSGVLAYDLQNGVFLRDTSNPLPGGPGLAIDRDNRLYIGDFNRDSLYVYGSDLVRENAWGVGDGPISLVVDIDNVNSISENEEIAQDFVLAQNYPNPFNPGTTIAYQLEKAGQVTLDILNGLGQKVNRLSEGWQSAGRYEQNWNGRDEKGNPVSSGVYFYRLRVNGQVQIRTMHLIR